MEAFSKLKHSDSDNPKNVFYLYFELLKVSLNFQDAKSDCRITIDKFQLFLTYFWYLTYKDTCIKSFRELEL